MRIYIKGDYTKEIPFDYLELAKRMWFENYQGEGDYTKKIPYGYLELAGKMWFPEEKQVSYSNAGNNDALQDDFSVNLSLRNALPIRGGILLIMLKAITLLLLLLRKNSLFYNC